MKNMLFLKKVFAIVFSQLVVGIANAQTAREMFDKGFAYGNSRQYDKAIESYTEAIKLGPDMAGAYMNRGFAYIMEKQYDAAIQDYSKAINLAPDNKLNYYNRGYCYQQKMLYDLAIKDLNKTISIDPAYALGYQVRGNIYAAKMLHDLALQDHLKAITLDPGNSAHYYNAGVSYNAKRQFDAAISVYNQAISLKPDYVIAYYGLGLSLSSKKEYDAAILAFTKAINIDQNFLIAYNSRGLAYLFKGIYDFSVNDLKKAISLDVQHDKPSIIINIIEPLVRLHRFAEAATYFSDYRSKYVSGYIDSPYWLFFKKYIEAGTENLTKNDYSKALNNLTEAEKLYSTNSKTETPDDTRDRGYSSILALKGYVLSRINNNELALQSYEQALLINKSQPDVVAALKELAQKKISLSGNDATPPTITILEPLTNNRSISVEDDKVATTKQRIRGKVNNAGSVKSLSINNSALRLEENGYFDTLVNLIGGTTNVFTIAAIGSEKGITVSEKVEIVAGKAKPAAQTEPQPSNVVVDYSPVYHAVLIAESDYADMNIPSLKGPLTDMKKIYNLLTKNYFFTPENTDTLVSASRANILETIIKKANAMGENDNLLVFYAGHGEMIKQPDQSEEGFLVPQDAVRGKLSSYVSSDDLLRTIKYSKARHILFIADACFAGSLFRDLSSEAPSSVAEAYMDKSRKLLASGNRTAVPDQSEFIEALRLALQENKDKYVTAEQLIDRFKNEYRNTTHLQLQYFPIKNVDDLGGQFVFKRK
ncbi:MAG: tetratricopeptide repeat protein [Ferruginibacter sp.]